MCRFQAKRVNLKMEIFFNTKILSLKLHSIRDLDWIFQLVIKFGSNYYSVSFASVKPLENCKFLGSAVCGG